MEDRKARPRGVQRVPDVLRAWAGPCRRAATGVPREADEAVSPVLGLTAGLLLYVVGFVAYVEYAGAPVAGESSTIDVDLQDRAAAGLDLVVTGGGDWTADPDLMKRFGLSGPSPNFLSFEKLALLRKGQMQESSNDYPDYPESRRALGFTDHEFHLRTYPVLVSIDDAKWAKLRGIRAAYVADFGEPSSSADVAAAIFNAGSERRYQIEVTNRGADPMIFVTSFTFDVDGSTKTTTRQTKLLAKDEAGTLEVRIHPLKKWDQATLAMTLKTADNYDACAGCDTKTLSTGTVESGNYLVHLLADLDASYYVTGDTVKVHVDHFDKDGNKRNGESARLRVYRPSAAFATTQESSPMHNVTDSLPHQRNQRWTVSCACADREGLWRVVVTPTGDYARETAFTYWVDSAALFGPTAISAVGANERTYLDELVEDFDPAEFTSGGDVFRDDTQTMRDLEPLVDNNPPACDRNPRYDLVVVGSDVAHNALVKIKEEVANFVDCGGTLIALGSQRSGTEWLQSVYHVALRGAAGGGISAPDATHPLLTVPEQLSWSLYSPTDYVWDIKPGQDIFSHAVDGADASKLMLGVSKQGILNGTVVLTGWTPGTLTAPQDHHEAKRLLHNTLVQGYRMIFLDYGPPIPRGTPVGSSSRLAAVAYADLPDAPHVEVKVVLYVWRN